MNLKLSILQILNLAKPYLMPANALRAEVETRHHGRIGDEEFAGVIRELKERGLIDHQIDQLTGDAKYRITNAGESILQH